jgi:hypothetical protein
MATWSDICAVCGASPAQYNCTDPAAGVRRSYCTTHGPAAFAASRAAHKRDLAARRARGAEAGRAFWAARGIRVGETVRVYGWHLLGGRFPILGTAKAGVSGPYVFSPRYGHLAAEGAEKAQ